MLISPDSWARTKTGLEIKKINYHKYEATASIFLWLCNISTQNLSQWIKHELPKGRNFTVVLIIVFPWNECMVLFHEC